MPMDLESLYSAEPEEEEATPAPAEEVQHVPMNNNLSPNRDGGAWCLGSTSGLVWVGV